MLAAFYKDVAVHQGAGEGERRQAFINTSCQMVPALQNITAVITSTCPFVSSVGDVRALLVEFAYNLPIFFTLTL